MWLRKVLVVRKSCKSYLGDRDRILTRSKLLQRVRVLQQTSANFSRHALKSCPNGRGSGFSVSSSTLVIHVHTCDVYPLVGGEPVRISSMVLLVAYAFYYKNVFSIIIYHHMPRERRCLRHSGAQQ